MNPLTRTALPVSIVALALTLSSPTWAATSDSRASSAKPPASLAELYPYGRRASDLMGMTVRGSTGENLGKVDELVVDADSGQVVYAIVSSGGVLGMGDTLRAVPFSALRYASEGQGAFTLNTTIEQWKRAPIYQENHIAELGGDAQARSLFEYYGQSAPSNRASSGGSTTPTAWNLRKAQDLADSDLKNGDRKVGHTEDLIVDPSSGQAAILVNPENAYANSRKKYVVPFSQLTARTRDDETLATTVTPDDFSSAKPLDRGWSSSGRGLYEWTVHIPSSGAAE